MARVVPSQVRGFIKQAFPFTETQIDSPAGAVNLGFNFAIPLAAVLELVEQIPNELIAIEGEDYVDFVSSIAAIRNVLQMWQAQGTGHGLIKIEGRGDLNPVTILRWTLEKCRDQNPSPSTAELTFIVDKDFRENLRLDIDSVTRSLANGDWKGATVVGGSVVEALLLWALQQRPAADVAKIVVELMAKRSLTKQPHASLEWWDLHEYIEVAAHLGILKDDTAAQARLAKNFRNLIHPGRTLRLGQVCNRGTALSVSAAVEHVVRDFTP